jgi:hypothetical protein
MTKNKISRKEGKCPFCGQVKPLLVVETGAGICTDCLRKAKRMVAAPPKLLDGVVECPSCHTTSFIVEELCHFVQSEGGVLEPVGIELSPTSKVRCSGCATMMEDDVEYTVLHRLSQIAEAVSAP